jgi:hypothetical protein
MVDRELPPLPPEHDAFLSASAALARQMGLPEGMHVCRIVGSVNGPAGMVGAPAQDRLTAARRAMQEAERRTGLGRRP